MNNLPSYGLDKQDMEVVIPQMSNKPPSTPHFIERVVPGESPETLYLQHLERYQFAARSVADLEVLDVACGAGYAAPLLCGAGARRYLGVDIDPGVIARAEKQYRSCGRIEFHQDDACELATLQNDTFDAAVSFETIEHLAHPRRFLRNVCRVLRPGGLLVISTPNRFLYSPGQQQAMPPVNPFHVREWNQDEFLKLLREFFEIQEVLGQSIHPIWKARVYEQASRYKLAWWFLQGCRTAKRFLNLMKARRRSRACSIKVERVDSRHSPVYLICVALARKRSGKLSALPLVPYEQCLT